MLSRASSPTVKCLEILWKFGNVYPTGGFAVMDAGYGDLRLRHVVVEDTLLFSCQTKAATSALVAKIV